MLSLTRIVGLFQSPALWPIKTHIVITLIQTYKSVPIGLYIIQLKFFIVTARTSRPNVSSRDVVLNVSSQSRLGFGIIRLTYNPARMSPQYVYKKAVLSQR